VHALYCRDEGEARARLNTAWLKLLKSRLAEDYHQVIRYRLGYLEFQIALSFAAAGAGEELLDQPLKLLHEPPAGEMSGEVQARLMLQLRLLAHRRGVRRLPQKEFDRLYRRVRETLSAELCFYISSWAFEKKRRELLEQVLEPLTVNATGYQSDFVWQRTNLMLKLLDGAATRRDAEELVKRITHPQNWSVIEHDLWPALMSAGLVDEQLSQLLRERLARFAGSEIPVPKPQPRTKRIGKDYGQ